MRLIIFDTETGGLDARQNPILTLAMVPLDIFPSESSMTYTVGEGKLWAIDDPGSHEYGTIVEMQALAVNGIDLEQHRATAQAPREVCEEIDAWFAGLGFGLSRWVELGGHNQAFDMPFLERLWKLGTGRPMNRRFSSQHRCTWALAQFMKDVGAFDMRTRGGPLNLKLVTLCAWMKIDLPPSAAHNALNDATATAHLMATLLSRLRSDVVAGKDAVVEREEQRALDENQ